MSVGKSTISPHYVNVASAVLHTGISEVVVVVGTQRLFAAMPVYWLSSLAVQRSGTGNVLKAWAGHSLQRV